MARVVRAEVPGDGDSVGIGAWVLEELVGVGEGSVEGRRAKGHGKLGKNEKGAILKRISARMAVDEGSHFLAFYEIYSQAMVRF